jgi:arabinan endo-1,5-alpha-L-arabinosidase
MTMRKTCLAISIAVPLAAVVIAASPVPRLLDLTGDIGSHDPHIIKAGGAYYVYSSGGSILTSKDLHHWTRAGRLFDKLPDWVPGVMPQARAGTWAPDVAFFNGKYHCYYTLSVDFSRNSLIGLVTNKTLDPNSPDYQWADGGLVVRSGGDTDWNAIDAAPFVEDENNVWLMWGSYWSGIKMHRIDPKTGLFSTADTKLYDMAAGPRTTSHEIGTGIEGSYMFRHEGYWYLFASLDECCSGDRSTYAVVVGRSHNVTGPFVDRKGIPMIEGGGSMVIQATTPRWREPGHNSALHDETGDYFVFHATPGTISGITGGSRLFISTIVWEEGWPRVAELP